MQFKSTHVSARVNLLSLQIPNDEGNKNSETCLFDWR